MPAQPHGARPIRVGVLTGQWIPFADLLDDARFVERLGFDNLWLPDHFVFSRSPEVAILESWTTLAAVAVQTERIRIGHAITNVAMRNPGVLCKQALTLDEISGGRLEVGIGAGGFASEARFLGIDPLDPRGRAERLAEAAEILDTGLRGGPVSLDGTHWRIKEMPMRPLPIQKPRPPLWIAVEGAISARAAARHGDAAVFIGEGDDAQAVLQRLRDRIKRLETACTAEGRDPASIRLAYFSGWAEAERPFDSEAAFEDFIDRYAGAGVTDFIFMLYNPAQPRYASRVGGWADRAGLERAAGRLAAPR